MPTAVPPARTEPTDPLPCTTAWVQHARRFQQFKSNLRDIVDINHNNPTASWWAAPNQFTDLSWPEFSKQLLGIDAAQAKPAGNVVEAKPPASRKLMQGWPPTVIDWAAAGGTTPVKNQGSVSRAAGPG